MLHSRHTLIVMTRRYGKSSLLAQTFDDTAQENDHHIMEKLSLLTAYDVDSVIKVMLNSIGKLAGKMLPKHEMAAHALKQLFQRMQPEWTVGVTGPRVRLSAKPRAVEMLTEAILDIDRLAVEKGFTLTLAMDEFQQIAMLDKQDALSIEAAIREAAQNTKRLCLIFTGSSRAMLTLMFEDQSRPFFHLCEKITLDRIAEDDYIPFLNKAAMGQWHQTLTDEALSAVMQHTARHPYYVNALCACLWRKEQPPTASAVAAEWLRICQQEGMRIAKDIATLKPNQRAILQSLALHPIQSPYSQAYLSQINISNGSMQRVIPFLLDHDLIYLDENRYYRLIDPCLEQYLVSLSS